MDDHRFDDLVRTFATRRSRRDMLKGLLGGALGGTLGMLGLSDGAASPADTVDICHRTGNGSFQYIEVSANAVPAHAAHGDIIAPDFWSDPANCGGCGNVCADAPANATATCADGTCGFDCDAGYTDCGGNCIDSTSDLSNCGGCGVTCQALANGTVACVGGTCQVTCNGGFEPDGAGGCQIACNAGYSLCNGTCIETTSDTTNCGGCGITCPTMAGCTTTCLDGQCQVIDDYGEQCRSKPLQPCGNGIGCYAGPCIDGTCCPGELVCNGMCCQTGNCINGECCIGPQICGDTCCPYGSICVQGSCCPWDRVCGGTDICCAEGTTCVNGQCVAS